jgi:hypothetical protein
MLNNNIHIVTVATEPKFYFEYLKKSCENNGKNLEVLGFGEEWKGFAWRFLLILDYIKKLREDDIICFIDGYDVICVRDLSKLKDEFLKIQSREKCKIIVGMEIHLDNGIIPSLVFGKCKGLSINAGTYIGYIKDIYEILNNTYNLNPDLKADDQLLITKYCNKTENDIYIDKNNELFLTIVNEYNELDELIKIDKNEVVYNDNKPFFIHGPSNTYLDNLIIKLGYDYNYNNKIKDLILENYLTKKKEQILNHIYQYKESIYVIIISIILFICLYRKYKNQNKN